MSASFVSRTLVNGGMLRQMTNKNISIMLRVVDESDGQLNAMSTDGNEIRVQCNESLGVRKGDWVEIIGVATGNATIRANEAILFSDEDIDFDMEAYNMLVGFMNNVANIFRSG